MGRGARQRARLRALQQRVWGERGYEQVVRQRTRRQQRLAAVLVTGIGAQLVLTAVGLVVVSTAASAHTSTINISCARVEFVYQNFPRVAATAHESVLIDGVEAASRDISFQGPGTTDTITISLGPGTHTVAASDHWAYRGQPRGSAQATQQLSYCHTGSTTTIGHGSTTSTSPSSTSTSTVPITSSTTTPTSTTTTTVPETTSTTAPGSTTSVPDTSTSTVPSSTSTTVPTSSTTEASTSTTFHELGSTTTTTTTMVATSSSTVHEQGSTSTTSSHGPIPLTGSSGLSLAAAVGALGVGILTLGLTRLRKAARRY